LILNTPTIPGVKDLPRPAETSVSIITPPAVTLQVLKDAAEIGVRRVWMQPGAWDGDCVALAKERGMEAVVYGHGHELGGADACVLMHGEDGMERAML
jgi:predicted CoA-binding protein